MNTWRIQLDRYGNESLAKSGQTHSLNETLDIIIKRYQEQLTKPKIEVVAIGVGHALAALLENSGVPVKRVGSAGFRLGSSDVLVTSEINS